MFKTIPIIVMAALCLNFSALSQENKTISNLHRTITLNGMIQSALKSDTLTLKYWEYFIKPQLDFKELTVVAENGKFSFQLPAFSHPIHIELRIKRSFTEMQKGKGLPISLSFVEPGDSIKLTIDKDDQATFSGRGATKFICKKEAVDSIQNIKKRQSRYSNIRTVYNLQEEMLRSKDFLNMQIKVLDKYKDKLSPIAYKILKADYTGWDGYNKYLAFKIRIDNMPSPDQVLRNNLINIYYTQIQPLVYNLEPDSATAYSTQYKELLIYRESVDRKFIKLEDTNSTRYKVWAQKYSGFFREYLLSYYLLAKAKAISSQELDFSIKDIQQYINNPALKNMIQVFSNASLKGADAYNFNLQNISGKNVKLSDFKGKVVLIDYWFTGCINCEVLTRVILKEVHHHFQTNKDIVFITISVDKDRDRWINSVRKNIYTTPGSIDLYTGGQGGQHSLIKHYQITGYPQLMLIGPDGKMLAFGGLLTTPDKLIAILNNALNTLSNSK